MATVAPAAIIPAAMGDPELARVAAFVEPRTSAKDIGTWIE
jgi:hypothetical protein